VSDSALGEIVKQYYLDMSIDFWYNVRFYGCYSLWDMLGSDGRFIELPEDNNQCEAEQCLVDCWIEAGEIKDDET